MDANTGEVLGGLQHLKQSIRDILTTPLGSRVMRRDYGSRIFELLDRPMGAELVADIQAAVAMALIQEPRIRLTSVTVKMPSEGEYGRLALSQGNVLVSIEGYYLPEGRQVTLQDISIS